MFSFSCSPTIVLSDSAQSTALQVNTATLQSYGDEVLSLTSSRRQDYRCAVEDNAFSKAPSWQQKYNMCLGESCSFPQPTVGAEVSLDRLRCHLGRAAGSKESRHPKSCQCTKNAPCLPSPKYQADIWLAASRACNHKIRKKQKWNATLVCLLWSDAGLIPKIRIGFWSWQSRTCSKESTPPSKRYSDVFIPPANLTISQEVGGWPDTYSPTIKGATHPGEPPWRSFPSLLSCLHFSSSSM